MFIKIIRFIIVSMLIFFYLQASAQDEYRAEIGLAGGGAYYLGDANKMPFRNTQLNYGGFLRYRFNNRIALRAEINNTKIKGNYTGKTKLTNNDSIISFENSNIYAADLCAEFNFFDLEQIKKTRLSKIFSPFIFAGVGLMNYPYSIRKIVEPYSDSIQKKILEPCISFGIGFKVKLAERWNLNAQWSNRLLLFSDQIEGITELANPNKLNGSNIFNNDMLSTLTIGVSYDIWKKQCDCKNIETSKDKHNYKKH